MSHHHRIPWNDIPSKDDIECCLLVPPIDSAKDDESPQLPLIEARTVGDGDRRAFARQDIAAGEVLVRNVPLAFVVHPPNTRCGACFRMPGAGGSGGGVNDHNRKNQKLSRCGRCQCVWYCSRECQIQDFPLHRLECREATALLAGEEDWRRNARLLIRTYLTMVQEQQPQRQGEAEAELQPRHYCRLVSLDEGTGDGGSACCCSSRHFQQLQPSTSPLDPDEQHILQLAVQVLTRQAKILQKMGVDTNSIDVKYTTTLRQELESILRRFRVNNFGMVDDMIRLVGSGVYPLGALLNHSCAPNCLLRYTTSNNNNNTNREGVMEIVAGRAISMGEEVTHSYVELVATTETRQERLKEVYGFTCQCSRCHPTTDGSATTTTCTSTTCTTTGTVPFPMNYLERDASSLAEFVLDHFNPLVEHRLFDDDDDEESKAMKRINVSVDELLHRPPCFKTAEESSRKRQEIQHRVQTLQQQANHAMANDDLERELQLLSEAVRLLESSKSTTASTGRLPYFGLDLYQVRCQRLSSWIVAQQPERAVEDCQQIVAVLCLALSSHTPNHPLLGLQLFTLGDLYEACGQLQRAAPILRWAQCILSISQGPTSEMVQLLDEKLSGYFE